MDLAARTYDRGLILGRERIMATRRIRNIAIGGGVSEVGVRELRDGLSRHLASVREGHTITITDHGRPVARIVPVGAPTSLERLIADEVVTPARRRPKPLPPPVATAGSVSDLVEHQRR